MLVGLKIAKVVENLSSTGCALRIPNQMTLQGNRLNV